MALYTILLGLSIFLIALVIAIIRKMFFHWKEEHKSERMVITTTDRPAVSVIIYTDNCVIRQRRYSGDQRVFDIISKSDINLPNTKKESFESRDVGPDEDDEGRGTRDDRKDQEKALNKAG